MGDGGLYHPVLHLSGTEQCDHIQGIPAGL